MAISESKRWVMILWSTMLFMLIASPFAYMITRTLFTKLGIRSQQCPNYIGLVVHGVIFAILLRLVMLLPFYKKNENYKGLSARGDFMACNAAQLMAQNAGCDVCYKAAQTCMEKPFDKKCNEARKTCISTCSHKNIAKAVDRSCNIHEPETWL